MRDTITCLGFGRYKGKCTNKAGGLMLPKSIYWCDRCENLRRVYITNQMKSILKSFERNQTHA